MQQPEEEHRLLKERQVQRPEVGTQHLSRNRKKPVWPEPRE